MRYPSNTFLVAAVLVALVTTVPLTSLAQDHAEDHRHSSHILKADHYDAHTSVLPVRVARKSDQASANIEVTYIGFSSQAQNAFQHAVDLWEEHIASPVTIRIRARWQELDENVLGSAGPSTFYGNFPDAPVRSTWYPLGLAHALTGQRFDGAPEYDIEANFSSAMTWYFGTDGRPPAGSFDLVTVVLHEIGHGLGFYQSFRVDDGDDEQDECPNVGEGFGCWGLAPQSGGTPFPVIFDRFVTDVDEVSLLNVDRYPNPSQVLGEVLQSGEVLFNGPSALAAYENVPIDLYSPASFEPASSIAHLDERAFPAGDPNSLMTPRLARAEAIHTPGAIFCGILEDIGWALGDGCFALLQAEIVAIEAERVTTTDGRVRLSWTTGPDVELDEFVVEQRLFDSEYQEVMRVPFEDGERSYSVTLDDLEPGRYTFRIRYVREDGSSSYSRSVEVTVPLTDQVAISGPFPNPFRTSTSVYVHVRRTQNIDAHLYDAMGRRVLTVASSQRVTAGDRVRLDIDAGSLSSGVYYLQIVGSEFKTATSVVLAR